MKKKFKDRKIGKFLTNTFVLNVIDLIPVGGSFVKNVLTEVNGHSEGEVISESGSINNNTIYSDVIKAIAGIVIAYLFINGNITFDEAQSSKELID